MQNLEQRRIPKRLHAYLSVQGSPIDFSLKSEDLNKTAKYAPKYYTSIGMFTSKDPRHLNAVQRIKKTVSVRQNDTPISQISRWRQILQNKFKTILKIDGEYVGEKWMWMNKAFSNIRFRSFEDSPLSPQGSKIDNSIYLRLIETFFRFLPGMMKLRFLGLSIRPKNPSSMFKKLNSMSRLLNSLQGLQIKYSWAKDCDDTTILPALVENENVLKCSTHLSLGSLTDDKSIETFKALPKHCKNLRYLRLDFSPKIPISHPHLSSLQLFENFERLEKLEIKVEGDPHGFIENFRGSPSLKHVSFVFEHGAWEGLFGKLRSIDTEKLSKGQSIEESAQANQIFHQFFKSWNRLENLLSLNLTFRCYSKMKEFVMFYFAELLLRSLSSLEYFSLDIEDPYTPAHFPYGRPQEWGPIDFGKILNALHGSVGSKLKSLCFTFPRKNFMTLQQGQENLSFPQLTSVDLYRNVCYPNFIQNLFNVLEKSTERIRLELPFVVIVKNEALLDLLRILEIAPRNSRISLTVMIYKLDLDVFDSMFGDFIKKARMNFRAESVSLNLRINEGFYREYSKALGFLTELFKNLEKNESGEFKKFSLRN